MKSQGVPKHVGEQVVGRDHGRCAVQATHRGVPRRGEQIHHRKPRGMGGSRDPQINMSANLVYVCKPCHDFIESNRYDAVEHGWIISGSAHPDTVPILYIGKWLMLTNDGKLDVVL